MQPGLKELLNEVVALKRDSAQLFAYNQALQSQLETELQANIDLSKKLKELRQQGVASAQVDRLRWEQEILSLEQAVRETEQAIKTTQLKIKDCERLAESFASHLSSSELLFGRLQEERLRERLKEGSQRAILAGRVSELELQVREYDELLFREAQGAGLD